MIKFRAQIFKSYLFSIILFLASKLFYLINSFTRTLHKIKKIAKSKEIHSLEKKFSTKIIHEIIKNKCEVVKSLQIDGVTNICAPIFDHTNHAIAAMTIPYLHKINLTKNDLSVKEATKLLKNKSLILSNSLGYSSNK